EWESYKKIMFDSITELRQMGDHSGRPGYMLYAVNILQLMGDVLCAFHLLKQAQVAQRKWKDLATGEVSLQNLIEENVDARFYWNKMKTTEYYVWSILPRALSNARVIHNACLTPLEAAL
ncbi:MAG: acyl-CoA dehydrogenase C-terminal domain-containing protein, partial [SAR324 cluster bacterium]|nr:acyl-CoA dehydrogenase C-terminal domain-containing protein [SAR324 cluster bacterium]